MIPNQRAIYTLISLFLFFGTGLTPQGSTLDKLMTATRTNLTVLQTRSMPTSNKLGKPAWSWAVSQALEFSFLGLCSVPCEKAASC